MYCWSSCFYRQSVVHGRNGIAIKQPLKQCIIGQKFQKLHSVWGCSEIYLKTNVIYWLSTVQEMHRRTFPLRTYIPFQTNLVLQILLIFCSEVRAWNSAIAIGTESVPSFVRTYAYAHIHHAKNKNTQAYNGSYTGVTVCYTFTMYNCGILQW